MNLDHLTELKRKMDAYRPLTQAEIKAIREYERIEQIYASNALEGNTLTYTETKLILETGITVSEKPLKDHLEVINLKEAMDFVESLVNGKEELNERSLKDIHRLVVDRVIDRVFVGNYRRIDVMISGSKHLPPSFLTVQDEMDKFFEWMSTAMQELHPVEFAALLHEKFVTIHPFADGNGRTARLLMNFALTKNGYPPIMIKPTPDSRKAYLKALEHGNMTGDNDPFIKIVADLVESKLNERIVQLEFVNHSPMD